MRLFWNILRQGVFGVLLGRKIIVNLVNLVSLENLEIMFSLNSLISLISLKANRNRQKSSMIRLFLCEARERKRSILGRM